MSFPISRESMTQGYGPFVPFLRFLSQTCNHKARSPHFSQVWQPNPRFRLFFWPNPRKIASTIHLLACLAEKTQCTRAMFSIVSHLRTITRDNGWPVALKHEIHFNELPFISVSGVVLSDPVFPARTVSIWRGRIRLLPGALPWWRDRCRLFQEGYAE